MRHNLGHSNVYGTQGVPDNIYFFTHALAFLGNKHPHKPVISEVMFEVL